MAQLRALQKSKDAKSGFMRSKDFLFAQEESVAPILIEELPHVIASLPACFVKDQNQNLMLVVLQSLGQGKNLLVHPHGKWLVEYVPAHYRGYPFALVPNQNGDMTLCIDEESGLIHEEALEGDERFFTEDGEPEVFTKSVLEFLTLRQKGLQKTQAVVKKIEEAGIIVPWDIKIKNQEDQEQQLQGVYKIDEKKLQSLDDEAFLALRDVLGVVYSILLSEHRLSNLSKLHNLHQQMAEHSKPKVQEDFDLDKFFEEQNDTLSF